MDQSALSTEAHSVIYSYWSKGIFFLLPRPRATVTAVVMASIDESEGIIAVLKYILGLCQRFLPEGRNLLAAHPNLANASLIFLWKIQHIVGILDTIQTECNLPQDRNAISKRGST